MAVISKDWEVDFNSAQIDPSVWNYELGYIRNHELQFYTDSKENARIEDGKLILCAKRDPNAEKGYTSACLDTKGKAEFLYGHIEMTAKLPKGTGIWPAFWMLGSTFEVTEKWPVCGEIDIMEMVGGRGANNNNNGDRECFSTIHFQDVDGKHNQDGSFTKKDFSLGDDFHTYGIDWDKKKIDFLFDGEKWLTVDISDKTAFHKPFFLLVNFAVGGDWPGDPDENTVFPQKYEIKSIRYRPL